MIAIQAQMIPLLQEDELNWYALIVLFQNFYRGPLTQEETKLNILDSSVSFSSLPGVDIHSE
jgi:hypothetical protein